MDKGKYIRPFKFSQPKTLAYEPTKYNSPIPNMEYLIFTPPSRLEVLIKIILPHGGLLFIDIFLYTKLKKKIFDMDVGLTPRRSREEVSENFSLF